ncbi:MAG TPA: hypothetical protein PKD53_20355 [Chloroflexaceae bacterium]|nr:hypothetical protein [Chloroflexaceae bacterium]
MPARQDYLLPASTIFHDRAVLDAIRAMPDYAPTNPAYSLERMNDLEAALRLAELEHERNQLSTDSSRRRLIFAHWAFHDCMLGGKRTVVSQYGPNSDNVRAVGLKRRSEHKRPSRSRRVSS